MTNLENIHTKEVPQIKKLDEILKELERLKGEVKRRYKADVIGIFGSYVRGEQTQKSDIDILVRFDKDATLLDFTGLAIFLEEKLGVRIDVVPYDTIRKELRNKIMDEVIFI